MFHNINWDKLPNLVIFSINKSFLQFYYCKFFDIISVYFNFFSSEFIFRLPFQSCPLHDFIRTKQNKLFHDWKISKFNQINFLQTMLKPLNIANKLFRATIVYFSFFLGQYHKTFMAVINCVFLKWFDKWNIHLSSEKLLCVARCEVLMVVDLYFTDCWWSMRNFRPAAQVAPNQHIKYYYYIH
jgi:hypothetical protein